jgi:hypothetical protein
VRRGATSRIARHSWTRSRRWGSRAWKPSFAARAHATAAAYLRFATDDAALLELMFAGKRRETSGTLHVAADRAFSVMLDVIRQGQDEGALEPGDPERIGLVLFATLQGIAALVSAGIVAAEERDDVLADALAQFVSPIHTRSE